MAETHALSHPRPDEHISACGLFCSNCGSFKKSKCPGCQVEARFAACPVRKCCAEKSITGCWDCAGFKDRDLHECGKVNNTISRVIGFFTKSDRAENLIFIRGQGRGKFIAMRKSSGRM